MSEIIKRKCPFCGEWVKHHKFCNGFCSCSAKYYSQDDFWLNRKTGERRVECLTMRDRLKSKCKIFRLKIHLAWLNFMIYVGLPLLKYIGYAVIIVTIPLWLPIYWWIERKRIKESEQL